MIDSGVVRWRLGAAVVIAAAGGFAGPSPAIEAQPSTFKVAYFNVQSGKGEPALPGRASTFIDTSNCTDPSRPMNGWGTGFVQQALIDSVGNDPGIVALGLGEAWSCATPSRVLAVLGWRAASSARNGIAVLARHGFAGPDVWQQLDTSLNDNPADTMWVVRVPVCLDDTCSRSIPIMAAHWYATAESPNGVPSMERQAVQTVRFMRYLGPRSYALLGDLNAWESSARTVCRQPPFSAGLNRLREAGYIDAWPYLYPTADGSTGMLNRIGCGTPEGAAWKRIDYAWSSPSLTPLSIARVGVVPAGEEAPSDHYGIVVEYPVPEDPVVPAAGPFPNGRTGPGDIVIHVEDATLFAGNWRLNEDPAAASGKALENPDLGVPKRSAALVNPVDYVEASFVAERGRPYRLWVRGKSAGDKWVNDSMFVQFSNSVTADGRGAWRIGSTNATVVSIEDCGGCGLSGWGWSDNGYDVDGEYVYFSRTGKQTIRIQTREDGVTIDQIVLSPQLYLRSRPGLTKDDVTVMPKTPAP